MSESDSTSAPRRSQRERKQAKQFVSISPKKRKRADLDTDEDGEERLSDVDEQESVHDDQEQEYSAPLPKPKAPTTADKKKGRPRGPPTTKRTRVTKPAAPKDANSTSRRRKKAPAGGDAFDAGKVTKDTKIASDNALFNAIMNPSAALQSTVEDFLESLSETSAAAQAELVNCILRACGSNEVVNMDEAVDYDGVVDALDNFTEALKQDDSPIYPLTSKLPIFKKFRRSLSEFLERLITSSAELGLLYTTDLMATLQTWVIAMSSSQLRSFRHTATVIALEVETALCDVAAAVEKEAEVIGRQREGERKRKASNKTKAAGGREKELEGKAAEVRERRTKLAEYLKEFIDGVFVHRYRDLDPAIRAECVRALGLWFKKYSGHFLDGAYLRYVGWVLSDSNTQVRLEAVKSLSGVYQKSEYIGSLQNFTERFKPRLVEMATGDTELSVRVAVIQVLGAIDGHGLLEDEQRESLCLLVFDEEAKVRKAVSSFVRGVWDDLVEERLIGKKASKQEKERAGVKALGTLLVRLGKALDKVVDRSEDDDTSDELNAVEGTSHPKGVREVAALMGAEHRGRTALAVEALWDEVEPVSDWEALLDVLLLDHSAGDAGQEPRGRRTKGKQPSADSSVDEAWRLEEVEEAVLLEVFVAALRKAKADASGVKKGEEETVTSDITRALIKGLPRLFAKHQTDETRIVEVLSIPLLMNLDLYLEMRMIAAYSSLWDDVIKQLTSHSSSAVLNHAVAAIRHLMDATSLSNTNSTKILELEDELATSLRDAVAGRDELEIATFTEDEVLRLTLICSRLSVLSGTRDMTSWMEEDEGGKQSSAWDIVIALAERGKLGYKEEEAMIDQCLSLLTLHIIWKARRLPTEPQPSPEEIRFRESFREQREALLAKLVEYAVGSQSNTADGVRRAAFQSLMNLHILFCTPAEEDAEMSSSQQSLLALSLDDEVQYRCAGFVQAEIERYADELGDSVGAIASHDSGSSDEEGEEASKKRKIAKQGKTGKAGRLGAPRTTRSQLEREYVFMGVVSTFLRAIRAGAVDMRHSAVLLVHHGRLGPAFDLCSKVIVEVLKEEGMYKDHGDIVSSVVTQALREAFTLYLEGVVADEGPSTSLAKLLVHCLIIRGAQLAVVRKLDSQHVVNIHTTLVTWIGKRIAAHESSKNKKARNAAILFFKVLQPLLGPIDNRDALKIKAHMEQVLAQAKIEVLATSPIWEPQRAYEKRLNTVMSKTTKGPAVKARKGQAKLKEVVSSDEEQLEPSGDEAINEPAPSRPRARPAYRSQRSRGEEIDDIMQDDEQANELSPPKGMLRRPTSPLSQSPDPPSGQQTPRSQSPLTSPSHLASDDEAAPEEVTPKASRKRGRPENDDEEEHPVENGRMAEASGDPPSPMHAPASPASSAGEIQIRRKRARH
ncbi:hypothetical protein BV25DRAFT_1283433 [Artomyces pyxidatus]|uniref:Uncharacterized protein n=1 Tax=Artomyces pyxidatus TaxID=48021 RepID=A0ACB8SQ39_9AGAM|nr:hypothetical protein BV25DRAFT_1283433 [Artomyces pyxidatus]